MIIKKKAAKQPKKVIWTYTKDKYLEIKFHCSITDMMPLWMPKVTLGWAGTKYDIFEHDMLCFSRDLRECFQGLLANKRPLAKPLLDPKELGYVYHQMWRNKITYEEGEWTTEYKARNATTKTQDVIIWLYNDEHGQIIFHMGERYSDHLKKRRISYRAFIQNYQPLFVEVIPHHVVRSWLAQSDALDTQLQENERLWKIEHERLKRERKCKECLEEAAQEAAQAVTT